MSLSTIILIVFTLHVHTSQLWMQVHYYPDQNLGTLYAPYIADLCPQWKATGVVRMSGGNQRSQTLNTDSPKFVNGSGDTFRVDCNLHPPDAALILSAIELTDPETKRRKGVRTFRYHLGKYTCGVLVWPRAKKTVVVINAWDKEDYIQATALFSHAPTSQELSCLEKMVGSVKVIHAKAVR
jgi:hypothetical protein